MTRRLLFLLSWIPFSLTAAPSLIVHGGKIVTVDKDFRIVTAMAVDGERIVATGGDAEVLQLKDGNTKVIDLKGRMVLPGLMDSSGRGHA